MKGKFWKMLLPAGIALACLAGCGKEKAHYDEVERKAVEYYKDKYGDKVTVVNGFKAGNSALFGYIGVDDRAYEMSDGTMVYWNDKEEYFADNRQAAEITAALRSQVVEPALEELDPGASVTMGYSFNRTGMESFDECVFREYFDGDIEAFAAREVITIRDLDAAVHESAYPERIERFYNRLHEYMRGYPGYIGVYRDEYADEMPLDPNIFDMRGSVKVRAIAYLDLNDRLKWLDNTYVDVIDGVKIMCDEVDISLEPGDVTFEDAGTGADLQKKLDDGYYAMPVDAKENEKGGYSVRDQRHESRVILADLESPVYRIKYSERLRELVGDGGGQSFYIMVDDPARGTLWRYLDDDTYKFTVFKTAEYNLEKGGSCRLSEGCWFYFGDVTFVKYGE